MMSLYEIFQLSEGVNPITLEATVASGFEPLAMTEIQQKILFVSHLCKSRGRVFFSTSPECLQQALKLRSIDHLYLVLSTGKDIVFSDDKILSVESLEKLIDSPNWENAIHVWKSVSEFKGNCFPSKEEYQEAVIKEAMIKEKVFKLWKEKELIQSDIDTLQNLNQQSANRAKRTDLKQCVQLKADRKALYCNTDQRCDEDKVLKFRVTCFRSGKHSFTSQEAACSLGGKLQEKFNWVVDLVNYDLEVIANVREDFVYLVLSLTRDSLHKRNIVKFGPTTLRATVCFNLLQLAAPRPGDIIMDPLCGGGSIPIEGACAFGSFFCITGDLHPIAVARMYENFKFMPPDRRGYVDSLHWDVTNLPLKDASVDILVTDLPFGKRSGSRQNNQILYQKAMLEIGRCIVPSGRAVCLTWDKTNLTRTVRAYSALWSTTRILTINLGGLKASVYVLRRTSESFSTFLEILQKKKRKKQQKSSQQ